MVFDINDKWQEHHPHEPVEPPARELAYQLGREH
jgi:hypothetical protein